VVAPDQNKFYWDYSDDTNKTGYGLLFRGRDVGPGVKCMLRERRRGTVSIDAKYDDTYFILQKARNGMNYQNKNPDLKDILTWNVQVKGPQSGGVTCRVMWKWCPGGGGECSVGL
tara:strand:+ start:715 stop:1059 length:345 start_codon:yes stop_codon:yes gene_type:complete